MLPNERLDQALNRRRLDRRMDWNDVAQAIGISPESLRAIRKGRNGPKEITARALDDWLDWEPGSTERLFEGGEPTPRSATVEPKTVTGTAHAGLGGLEAEARGVVTPGPLAGLPEEHGERVAELSKRLDRAAEEQRQIAAELARLLGRDGPGASKAG